MVQYTVLTPAIHPRIDRVPIAEAFGKTSPFAAVFGDIQDGVQNIQVVESNIATLFRKAILDLLVLSLSNFHAPLCAIRFLLIYERRINLC